MKKLKVIVEKADDGFLGRIQYENNLIVEEADSFEQLEASLRRLLKKFHGTDPNTITFDYRYDLFSLFEKFEYLNITAVAKRAGMNATQLRNYKNGHKYATERQSKKIEDIIHELGKELLRVKVHCEPNK